MGKDIPGKQNPEESYLNIRNDRIYNTTHPQLRDLQGKTDKLHRAF